MNKADLVNEIANHAELTKREATLALEVALESIADALKAGEDVTLVGFGSFSVKEREARTGRNPQTGAAIEIPASQTVTFKAGKALKDAVN